MSKVPGCSRRYPVAATEDRPVSGTHGRRRCALCPLLACLFVAVIMSHARSAQEELQETVLRGVENRSAVLRFLSGAAYWATTASPRYNTDALRAARLAVKNGGGDPASVQELGRTHVTLIDFGFFPGAGRWRFESVDLTNSGHMFSGAGHSPAMNRGIPPMFFYFASVCDGTSVYDYDECQNIGWIHPYESEQQAPRGLKLISMGVLRGVAAEDLGPIRAGRARVTELTRDTVDGRKCLKLTVRQDAKIPAGEACTIDRIWVAPDLDYATVRAEGIYYRTPAPGRKLILTGSRIYTATNFTRVSDALWCPQAVLQHFFTYTKGKGIAAWDTTEIVRTTIQANGPPPTIVTPYRFPFNATIYDAAAPAGAIRPGSPRAVHPPAPARPDQFGVGLTAEKAQALLEATK